MIIRSKTFRQWFNANLKDYAYDIASHGANSGFPGITYYRDTCKLYDKFKDEIWEMLIDDARDFGYSNPFELVATFRRSDVNSVTEVENLLVWYAAERVAREISDW